MQSIFKLYGWDVLNIDTIQQGLINKTYSVKTDSGDYILQYINQKIFKEPNTIDDNINLMGSYIKQIAPNYTFTNLIPSHDGQTLIEWGGGYYRAFQKVEGYALSVLENTNQVKQAAQQFAKFTQVFKGFNCNLLKDTLPQFHDLNFRYFQFTESIRNGVSNRIQLSQNEIQFLLSFKKYVYTYSQFIQSKEVKKRVTHHDTKISNVLFHKKEGIEKAICVIDLDTTMAGYFISDVGDMCRTYLCPVSEEEKDLNKVLVDAEKWDALKNGYLNYMQDELSNFEKDHLLYAGQFIIYMQALRFLTDFLNKDVYYGAKYDEHNLHRTQNQIRLLEVFNQLN